MADHAEDDNDGDIFVYRGGRAPQHVTHVRIDKSVDEIEDHAFENCVRLVKVETHDGIRKVGFSAFNNCRALPQINLKSVVEIDEWAFGVCENLVDVEFGDELETIIGEYAFWRCTSLTHLKLPSVISIGSSAFAECALIDIKLSERLETIGKSAFLDCEHLRRIAIPLKRDLFEMDWLQSYCYQFRGCEQLDVLAQGYTQFRECEQLTTVDLVEGIHKTVASLHMESWRAEMIAKINRINQDLPTTNALNKTSEIWQWMDSVLDKMDRYKTEHCRYVKEGITLLELALWKAKLGEKEESAVEGKSKKAKLDAESARKERRITCGADMVIKNVIPFLKLV